MTTAARDRPLSRQRAAAIALNRGVYWVSQHGLALFSLVLGLFVGLPFLAPVLMKGGLEGWGRAIYALYSVLCHQLPQRSFFLFGPQITYSLPEVQAAWPGAGDFLSLRSVIGSAEMGWKVAWSDRMVAMATSTLVFAWIGGLLRRRLRPIPAWGLALLLLPMGVDGLTHMLSETAGLGQGFRDTNRWLVSLTGSSLPSGFYAGDAWGSFNSGVRLLTGILFGWGVVGFGFPVARAYFDRLAARIRGKFERAGLAL